MEILNLDALKIKIILRINELEDELKIVKTEKRKEIIEKMIKVNKEFLEEIKRLER